MADTPRVTVPVEPTPDMNIAGGIAICEARATAITPVDEADACFRAMLSAAPAPEGGAVSYAAWDVVRRVANLTVAGGDPLQDPAFAKYPAIADLVAKAQAALATREEAPAETGERDRLKHAIADGFSNGYERYDDATEAMRLCYDMAADAILALRAQPPAREDAQPVYALEVVRDPTVEGAKRFVGVTHPAPDALRVAVEALEPFARAADTLDGLWSEDDWRWNDSVRCGVTVRDIRRARQALAALQAEQKGGA